MTKDKLLWLTLDNDIKTVLNQLYRITTVHLKNEKLTKSVTSFIGRYNALKDDEYAGVLSNETKTLRENQLRDLLITFIKELPGEKFPFQLPLKHGEIVRAFEELSDKKQSGKSGRFRFFNTVIFFIVGLLVGMPLTYLIYREKPETKIVKATESIGIDTNKIDSLERNFRAIFTNPNSSFPTKSGNANYGKYGGLWELDMDSIGFVNGKTYNILDSIGEYSDTSRLVFYPLSNLFRVWPINATNGSTREEYRGIEFVRTVILAVPKEEKVKKYNKEEINKMKVAELGTIFFNQFYVSDNSGERTFFNMLHLSRIEKGTENDIKIIKESLDKIAETSIRTCNGITNIRYEDSKITFSFTNCDYNGNNYTRTVRRIQD